MADRSTETDEKSIAAQEIDHSLVEEITTDVREYFASEAFDASFAAAPSIDFIETAFFDFGFVQDQIIEEYYWVNKPFAFITILRHPGRDKLRYRVCEPVLNPLEDYVKDNLVKVLRNSLMYQDLAAEADRQSIFSHQAKQTIQNRAAATLDDGSLHKLLYYLERDFVDLGPIDPIMRDADIEDISCDGTDVPVFVYHFDYRDLRTNVSFDQQTLSSFVLRLAQRAGEQISVSDPLVDGSLPDGSRVQLTFESDISTRGSNFTIRKFADIPYTPVDLIQWETFSVEQMAYFWLAIENNRSLIFAGGTGSGKTTSMNAVSFFIPEDSKVVSIEDTREITLPHDNWVQSVTRDSITTDGRGSVSMYELLQAALRQRPEYILVGEIRTEQNVAFAFFQAIGTGHTAYTTIHADSMEGVLNRLENPPLSVPTQMIQDLDIVSIQAQIFEEGRRVRRNQQVTEVMPASQGTGVRGIEVFRRDADTDQINEINASPVLSDVADQRGWSDRRLNEELSNREELLQYLVDNDIHEFDPVTKAINAFETNRDTVLEQVRAGTFDPVNLDLEADL